MAKPGEVIAGEGSDATPDDRLRFRPTLDAGERRRQRYRLKARSSWLSAGATLSFVLGLLTLGVAAQSKQDLVVRAASGAPFAVALGGAVWARVTRAKLRALSRREDGSMDSKEGGGTGSVPGNASDGARPGRPPGSQV